MKRILYLVLLMATVINTVSAQKALRIYTGINVSAFKSSSHFFIANPKDSVGWNAHILPMLNGGFDVDFAINKKISFTTGIGISGVGVRKYALDTSSVYFVDPRLKIHYFRVPLMLKYRVAKNVEVLFGYNMNYSVRKNHNYFVPVVTATEYQLKNYYHNFYHTVQVGGLWDITNHVYIQGLFQLGLNPIADTKSYLSDYRFKLHANVIQLSVGYRVANLKKKKSR